MATLRLCSIPDCGKPHHSYGYCCMHATRLSRHGDPLTLCRVPNGEAERYFRETVLRFGGDECLTWPFTRNNAGYAHMSVGGRGALVSRRVCEAVNGCPPTPSHQAAHSCGKGHEGCVNPQHLSWKTQPENFADKLRHGTDNRGERHPMARLSADDVREIRLLIDKMPQTQIASKFGVSQAAISGIRRREKWGWLE